MCGMFRSVLPKIINFTPGGFLQERQEGGLGGKKLSSMEHCGSVVQMLVLTMELLHIGGDFQLNLKNTFICKKINY